MKRIEPSDLGVVVCPHVFREERPILYVFRSEKRWQFLCGDVDHSGSNGHLVGVGHLTDRDPSLNELADLEIGCGAERKGLDDEWVYAHES